jgi:hypothetical protein
VNEETEDEDKFIPGLTPEDEDELIPEMKTKLMKMKPRVKFLPRGTRSISKRGAPRSTVWEHFNTKTAKYLGRPVCQKCSAVFHQHQKLL